MSECGRKPREVEVVKSVVLYMDSVTEDVEDDLLDNSNQLDVRSPHNKRTRTATPKENENSNTKR